MSDDPGLEPKLEEIGRLQAPYRREIVLHDARWDSGMRLLRVRIREGHRFTIMDIDAATASALASALGTWAADAGKEGGS